MQKLIFFIALAVILVSLPVHSIVISVTDGVINCDGITCPNGSTSCTVSEKTFGDLQSYKYIRFCTDANGVPTHTVEQELPNPYPGTAINNVSSHGGNRLLTEEERKKLDADMNKMVDDQNSYWKQWSKDFEKNLRKQFPPGFPFN